ncbi:MAG: alpha/beta hydrolase-fold protein [bacterium]|nr:alpha/beta hydrolase-fold protein [bacterium]
MPRWSTFDSFLADTANAPTPAARQRLVDQLLTERSFPWVGDAQATFAYVGGDIERVALNLDSIPQDPPFEPFTRLEGTNFWYVTHPFAHDDLLDYLLAVNDPMTPLATETQLMDRITRYWRPDTLNPIGMSTAGQRVSVLRMPGARPFPDWSAMKRVRHGTTTELSIDSDELGFQARRVTVYLPPGYQETDQTYPLVIVQDGQWMAGPLQAPYIADALIKHQRMQPALIAMIHSGTQDERSREYSSLTGYSLFLLTELLPMLQTSFRIDATRIAVGGVALGAVAAANAALQNPSVFSRLFMISAPLGKGAFNDLLREIMTRFEKADQLPARVYQSVGRYEGKTRFVRPADHLRDILSHRRDIAYRFDQLATGHGLVGFRAVLPEALAWTLPGSAWS